MRYAVELQELHKHYKGAIAPALNGLSLKVKEQQILGLLGPNGAGKTTTINTICGFVRPDKGTATVFGYDCIKEKSKVRAIIGVVPQRIALFQQLTGMENFMYIGRLLGIEDKKSKTIAQELLEKLGLEKHADKRIERYSGGMKRRANIIASLMHSPKLLILDEPTAGVDVQSRAMILAFLNEYRNLGNTILYTSHLMEEAEQLCDEVVIVDEGQYIANGHPKDLIANTNNASRLEDVFLHHTGNLIRD